jgi:hypothetical protein
LLATGFDAAVSHFLADDFSIIIGPFNSQLFQSAIKIVSYPIQVSGMG